MERNNVSERATQEPAPVSCRLLLTRFLFIAAPLATAALLFLTRLSCPLLEPEETRYAEIPRQMLAEGEILTPIWQGQPYWHKPPLFYWLVMASYQTFGVHDWSARLVPCLAGLLVVLTVYFWIWRTEGPRAGICSALVLALSARFLYQGRMVTPDSLLCLWVTLGLAAAHSALRQPDGLNWGWWLLSAGACALGLLTKGPVALALVIVPIAAWLWLEPSRHRPRLGQCLVYVGVALGLAAPWYVALLLRDGHAASEFFWLHNVRRFLDPFDHEQPFWYYLPILALGMLPWSLLAIPMAWHSVRRGRQPGRGEPVADRFVAVAFVCGVLFFSLSGCKRAGYILPAMPLAAIMLGRFLAGLWQPGKQHDGLPVLLTGTALGLGVAGALAAAVAGLCSTTDALLALLLLTALGLCLIIGRKRLLFGHGWATCATTVFLLLLVGATALLPAYHRRFSLRGQVRRHAADADVPVVCYPRPWDGVGFYLARRDIMVHEERSALVADLERQDRTLAFIKNRGYAAEFLKLLPASLEFVPCARQGPNVLSGFVRHKGH